MKVNAAYVPLDGGFPAERMRFIAGDAGLKAIVSMSSFREKLAALDLPHVLVDHARPAIDIESCAPLADDEVAPPVDPVCYIIYTSGTTGNPKGVVIEHPSICNFVRVAAELYGYAPGDRVYQGMTIAFDFSVEEIWVPLMAGATLIPARPGASLVGDELSEFLRERRDHRHGLLPDLAGDHRRGIAGAAHPAGRRRGLPAKSGAALVSSRAHHPEHLRSDRSHRHRHVDRTDAEQAGHHRPALADLFDRHSRSRRKARRSRTASSAKSASPASALPPAT